MAQHGVTLLTGCQELGAVAAIRGVEGLRGVDGGTDREQVTQPAGLVFQPAARGPGFFIGAIEVFLEKVIGAQLKSELCVTDEGRHILQLVFQPACYRTTLRQLEEGHIHGTDDFFHCGRRRQLEVGFIFGPALGKDRQEHEAHGKEDNASEPNTPSDSSSNHHVFPLFLGFLTSDASARDSSLP